VRRAVLAVVLVLAAAAPAAAALYRWTAADGTIHYTSDPESIPEARRAAAVEIGHPAARPAPPPPAPAPPGVVVPFVRGGAVVVDARLNGVPLRLLLDTGADRTVIAPGALARAGIDGARGAPVRITGVTGSAAATLVAVPGLDVAGVHVGPLAVIAHAVPGETLDGLLGRDVLDAFTVTFDAAGGRATLVPR
jgi:predicted aspartyl protease